MVYKRENDDSLPKYNIMNQEVFSLLQSRKLQFTILYNADVIMSDWRLDSLLFHHEATRKSPFITVTGPQSVKACVSRATHLLVSLSLSLTHLVILPVEGQSCIYLSGDQRRLTLNSQKKIANLSLHLPLILPHLLVLLFKRLKYLLDEHPVSKSFELPSFLVNGAL